LRSVSARELAEAERVLRRIDWLVERLQQADTTPQRERGPATSGSAEYAAVAALTRQLIDARREYEGLLHRVRATDPAAPAFFGSAAAIPGAQVPGSGMRAIQRALRDDEAMLQYFTTADTLILFVVTRADLRVAEVPLESGVLATRVRFARDLLSRREPPSDAARVAMRDLYGVLIAPAVRTGMLEGKRRLVVVPHAALAHVPFSALVGDGGRYLVEDFSILMLPSAAAFRMVREKKWSPDVNGLAVIAPFPDRLPGTKSEAASVRRIAREANTLTGRSATKPALRAALERARVVHVASHALLNELSPMFSRIELAAPKRQTPDNNGRLEVHELLGMSVQSQLVYLSGCETGSGVGWSNSFMRGQDYATLSQAFLYAGARNVVATLWRIDDAGAADFASRFYQVLAREEPPEALAEAQRQMLRGASYRAPRYWAAYTVSGDGHFSNGKPAASEANGGSRSVSFRFVGFGRRMGTR
jgi:CHAT domain-containing protein